MFTGWYNMRSFVKNLPPSRETTWVYRWGSVILHPKMRRSIVWLYEKKHFWRAEYGVRTRRSGNNRYGKLGFHCYFWPPSPGHHIPLFNIRQEYSLNRTLFIEKNMDYKTAQKKKCIILFFKVKNIAHW